MGVCCSKENSNAQTEELEKKLDNLKQMMELKDRETKMMIEEREKQYQEREKQLKEDLTKQIEEKEKLFIRGIKRKLSKLISIQVKSYNKTKVR